MNSINSNTIFKNTKIYIRETLQKQNFQNFQKTMFKHKVKQWTTTNDYYYFYYYYWANCLNVAAGAACRWRFGSCWSTSLAWSKAVAATATATATATTAATSSAWIAPTTCLWRSSADDLVEDVLVLVVACWKQSYNDNNGNSISNSNSNLSSCEARLAKTAAAAAIAATADGKRLRLKGNAWTM